MGLSDYKITDEQVAANGLAAAADKLTGTPSENKALFDKLVREIVKEALNEIVDALVASGGAAEIGFDPTAGVNETNVQDAIENVQAQLSAYALGEIPDGTITADKLADDAVTLAKIVESVLHTDNFGYPSAVAAALGVDPSTTMVSDVLSRLAEKFVLTGAAAPSASTEGTVGQLYVDTADLVWYRCTAVEEGIYTWEIFERDQLGDFRLTYKNTLGEKYLLANGASLTPISGYDEMYDYLTSTPSWQQSYSGTGVLDTVYGYSKVNGYFVVTGKTGDYAAFAYTTDPVNAAWTVKTIDSTVESYLTTKMIWTGTYYVAMGYTRVYDSGDENYDYTPFVYYSTTLTGTWTSYTPSFGTSYYAYSLEYLDGKLIASVQYTLYYNTDVTDGTWTSTGRNGKYIGWDGSNFFTTYNKVVYYGPTLSLGNSVSISLPTSGYQDMRITYQNGKYWAPYYGASGWALYYSENLSTWASVSMSGGASTSNTVALFYDEDAECYYKIDRYASSSQSAWIYYCQNPLLNDWTQVNLLSSVSVSWPIDFDLALNKNSDGQFCFPWAAATRIYVKYSSLLDGDAKALPNVSLSGTYVYIRVKT